MLKPEDLRYFRERETTERRAAAAAQHAEAREAHAALAEHYADRVWALEEATRRGSPRRRPTT